MDQLVEMRQITKTFGPVVALRGVDFAVRAGEVAGLVGDNGAGKSTLMKILTGVYQPDGGEIWFDDRRHRGAADSAALPIAAGGAAFRRAAAVGRNRPSHRVSGKAGHHG